MRKGEIRKLALQFLLQPLMVFKDKYSMGELIFQSLFYNRTHSKTEVASSIELNENLTIVGNPGEGKTCLMHYMFIEAQKNSSIFPVILDYRKCVPREPNTLIISFIKKVRKYFAEIKKPSDISEETTWENFKLHFMKIQEHMSIIPNSYIRKNQKLVIFIDDFDYIEDNCLELLKTYFVPFADNDKAIIVLSGRKPLIMDICSDDELRHAFMLDPKVIHMVRVDLKTLIMERLNHYNENGIPGSVAGKVRTMLKKHALSYIKKRTKNDVDHKDVYLGFSHLFYNRLSDITGRNLRHVEAIFPKLYQYQINNKDNNFDDFFCDSYINCTWERSQYLLDLVSEKTESLKTKHNNNSVLQIVLEYFYSNRIVNSYFYDTMRDRFGIEKEIANKAIEKLSVAPYALIDPDHIYGNSSFLMKTYKINRKGKFYLKYIIESDLYYDKLSERARINGNGDIVDKSANRYQMKA